MKRYPIHKILLIAAILSCLGCGTLTENGDRNSTVVIGIRSDFDSLNELTAGDYDALQVIQNMLCMSLTRLDENLEFEPYLAKSWSFFNGDSTLQFNMRDNVYWTDGVKTTAFDVLYTYELATDPNVGYPASSRFDLVEQVVAVDSFTVQFHFARPDPEALYDTQIPILPRHILKSVDTNRMQEADYNRKPVGNGPFQLVEWASNQKLVFEANKQFVFGASPLDRVIFSIIPDESALLNNLRQKSIDVVPLLSQTGLERIQDVEHINTEHYTGKRFNYIAWNLRNPMFSKQVRQALSTAIDKNEIIGTLMNGMAEPAVGPLTPFSWAYDNNLTDFEYDPASAKTVLNSEGWLDTNQDGTLDRDGQDFHFDIKTNAESELHRDIAVIIQAQLARIGVRAEVDVVQWNMLIDQVFEAGDFEAVVLTWEAGYTVNPTDLWHSNAIENGYNFVAFDNEDVDELIETARNMPDRKSALPLWMKFQRIVLDECPYTFLTIPDNIIAYNTRLKGGKFDVRGYLTDIQDWRLE